MHARRIISPVASPLLAVYSLALTAALTLAAPWWLGKLRVGGKYREGLPERLGRIPKRLHREQTGDGDRNRKIIWLHAVSVGEVLAAAPLVEALRAALPGGRVYVSTTTRTGQALARARFGAETVFYFPADFAFAVRAWFHFVKPMLVVLVESEFWPRFLYEADRAGIPVAVVNARISPRSWPRYRRLRRLWRPLLGTLALVHAQTEEDRERLHLLGAPRVAVGGNLKFDLPPPPARSIVDTLRAWLPEGVPVLVCGSTLRDEEALLLKALPAGAVLVLAPRHPERFDEVAQLLAAQQRRWLRLSAWRGEPLAIAPGSVLLVDSLGELAGLYALATVALVGGGFLHGGGHNPVEPASLGKPVVVGPGYANFLAIVHTLRAADAIAVADAAALGQAVQQLLDEPEKAAALGARARTVCEAQGGATARAVAALLPLALAEAAPLASGPGIAGAAASGAGVAGAEAFGAGVAGAEAFGAGVGRLRWQQSLGPLQSLYAAALTLKNFGYDGHWWQPYRLTRPVVSIGNLSVGGAGKTPIVIALARLLGSQGLAVDVLSRGYGRRSPQPVERVAPDGTAERYGDEPLLIAQATGVPVYVGASRYQAGLLAEQNGTATLHLLDDGFQHRRLARAVDIVVVHPSDAVGHLLPAGRLREPWKALARADILILRDDDDRSADVLARAGIAKPIWRVKRTLAHPPQSEHAVAFCAIAHPQEFFEALRQSGVQLRAAVAFRDHHTFTMQQLQAIASQAQGASALLTTEKDYVRLSPQARAVLDHAAPLLAVPLLVQLIDEQRCLEALLRLLDARRR